MLRGVGVGVRRRGGQCLATRVRTMVELSDAGNSTSCRMESPISRQRPRGHASGKPDLSGVWHVYSEPLDEKKRLFGPDIGVISSARHGAGHHLEAIAVSILLDYKPGEIVLTPEGQRVVDQRRKDNEDLTTLHCLPMGTPLATLVSEVQKIVQTPGLISDQCTSLDGIPRQILHRRPEAARESQPDLGSVRQSAGGKATPSSSRRWA